MENEPPCMITFLLASRISYANPKESDVECLPILAYDILQCHLLTLSRITQTNKINLDQKCELKSSIVRYIIVGVYD